MVNSTNTHELECRVVRLEREARLLKRFLALVALVALWLAAMGQTPLPDQVLRVKRVLICDDAGRTRADLALEDNHSVGLQLRDETQRPRVSLQVSAAGVPQLELRDKAGWTLARVYEEPLGGVTISLDPGAGKGSVRLGVDAGGVPELHLIRDLPEYRAGMHLRVERSPRLELRNWDAAPGGLTLHAGKYPLYQAASDAEGALDRAKDLLRPDTRSKDALNFLDRTIPWEQFGAVEDEKERLGRLVKPENEGGLGARRALLRTLLRLHAQYSQGVRKRGKPCWGPWMWQAAYSLSRAEDRHKGGARAEIKRIREALKRDDFGYIETLGPAARWIELLMRKEQER